MKLYKFQEDALKDLPAKFILSWDTGTGKTIGSLYHYDKLAYPKPLLIVAPASKIGTQDWQKAVEEYFTSHNKPLPEVYYYSYERFSRIPTIAQYRKTGDEGIWRAWLKKYPLGDYALIADECHRMANPQSGIGKALFQVASKANFFVGLSATPLPNGWISVANYFKIWGFTQNITSFKNRYCDIVTYKGFPEIRSYYHEGELARKWNSISKPLDKNKALDLPTVVSVPVEFETGPNYIKTLKERIFEDKFLDNPSVLLHALRQSTIDNKIPWLSDFLDETQDNVVIFYNYRAERNAILSMLKKNHKERVVLLQDGENHQVPSKDNWANMHRTITLAQYQSGSVGIELTYASSTIYFSPTFSYVSFEQSIGRTYRNGQTKKCTFYLLCSPGTIEKSIWAALRDKKNFDENIWYKTNIESIDTVSQT